MSHRFTDNELFVGVVLETVCMFTLNDNTIEGSMYYCSKKQLPRLIKLLQQAEELLKTEVKSSQ